jgi:membrane associated rhomboid family serine protease
VFLPIGDEPNPPGVPFFTYALIAINVVVFVLVSLPQMSQPADTRDPAFQEYLDVIGDNLPPGTTEDQLLQQMSSYDLFVFEYGYRPIDPSLLTLVTSMFLHGGLWHLLGNMLFLWIYGDNVEHRLGGVGYVVWYLVTGAAATLFHAAFASDSPIPLVGASGAISGVLGFYFLWFPHNRVRVLIFLFVFIRVLMLPARVVLGFYIVFSNILPFLVSQGQGGVAHGAHIGGFLAGVAVAFVIDRRDMFSRPSEYSASVDRSAPSATKGEALAQAVREGKFEQAAQMYFQIPAARAKRRLQPDDSLALGGWLADNGHHRAALTIYRRHLRDFPHGPGLAEAHAQTGLLQLRVFDEPTSAYQHLVEALDYDPSPDVETTIRQGLAEISAMQKSRVDNVH